MFEKDYRFSGDHAVMVDNMLIENGGIFDTVYDAFFTAAIVGILIKKKSNARGDKNNYKTIFADKFNNERENTNLILRTIILNDDLELSGKDDEKINRSFRNFATDEETKKLNRKLIESYAFAGIEEIYNKFEQEYIKKNINKVDIIDFVDKLIDLYSDNNGEFQNVRDKIIDMARR